MNYGRLNEIIKGTKTLHGHTNLEVDVEGFRKREYHDRIYFWDSGDRLTSSILPVKPMIVVFDTHDISLVNSLIEAK